MPIASRWRRRCRGLCFDPKPYQLAVDAAEAQLELANPPVATDPRGLAVVAREVGRQAQMSAMLDVFQVITFSYLFMLGAGVPAERRSTTQCAGPVPAAAEH